MKTFSLIKPAASLIRSALLPWLLCLWACMAATFAADPNPTVTWTFRGSDGALQSNVIFQLTPIQLSTQSNSIIAPFSYSNLVRASGTLIITNVVPQSYRATARSGNAIASWTNCLTGLTGSINASDYICGAQSTNGIAYSQAQADARFVLRSSGYATNISITATATPSPSAGQVLSYGPNGVAVWSNAPAVGGISVAQGTNIVLVTNGSTITIHGTGSGGGGSGDMTVAVNGVQLTNFIQAAHNTNASQVAALNYFTNLTTSLGDDDNEILGYIQGIYDTNAAQTLALTYLTNWTAAISNLANTKQHGSALLTNWSAVGITNIISADANGLVVRTNNGVLTLSNAMSAASGEANTASSLGTGWHIFHNKSSVDLRFNSLTNGTGLSSSSNANDISFAVDWTQVASKTNVTDLTNLVATKQHGTLTISNISGTGALTNSASLLDLTNLANTKQQGAAWLTNISGTGAMTNLSAFTNWVQTAHDTNANQAAALVGLTNIAFNGLNYFTNWTTAISNRQPVLVTNTIWIGAGAFAATGGSLAEGGRNGGTAGSLTNITAVWDTWDLDDTTNEMVQTAFTLGPSFAGFARVQLYWTKSGITNAAVQWEVAFSPHMSNSFLSNFVYASNFTSTHTVTNGNNLAISPQFNFTNPAPRMLWGLRIARLGTNASDTTTGDARFLGAEISIVETNWMGGF